MKTKKFNQAVAAFNDQMLREEPLVIDSSCTAEEAKEQFMVAVESLPEEKDGSLAEVITVVYNSFSVEEEEIDDWKPAAKAVAKPAAKAVAKAVAKPAAKAVAKAVAKPAAKAVAKPAAKAVAKPAAKAVAKAVAKPAAKPAAKEQSEKIDEFGYRKSAGTHAVISLIVNSDGITEKELIRKISSSCKKLTNPASRVSKVIATGMRNGWIKKSEDGAYSRA